MQIDYHAMTNQYIKAFKKEKGQKLGDGIRRIGSLHYTMMDSIYVYALFDKGRKTRTDQGIKELEQSLEVAEAIIKTVKEIEGFVEEEIKNLKTENEVWSKGHITGNYKTKKVKK